ncbi:hypothetical protein PQ455_08105 [Sphingomonas naphthae]|uniref:Lipoprotein n=1 Tax=Sphingomonas naphthae TaxID=1813468 RepID=A0ABY7TPK0_9SPHN|nr:hypothetical protein [Sphingomonas naphthae]WCT75167.1 hypothetical protein PQ455_08105 [Sphingomonas naphthae]
MRRYAAIIVILAPALAGCDRPQGMAPDPTRGRYAGVGIYAADKLWSHVEGSKPADPAIASPADDEYIIVVSDTQTGEIRQCGNHSGRCVSLKAWGKDAASSLPVRIDQHLADLTTADALAPERKATPPR